MLAVGLPCINDLCLHQNKVLTVFHTGVYDSIGISYKQAVIMDILISATGEVPFWGCGHDAGKIRVDGGLKGKGLLKLVMKQGRK